MYMSVSMAVVSFGTSTRTGLDQSKYFLLQVSVLLLMEPSALL